MDAKVEIAQRVESATQLGHDARQPGPAREKRFTAVQHDMHAVEAVSLYMLRDPTGRPCDRFVRNDFRTYLP
ncbi:hypothetical protein Psi02_63610 [Planotetraspora silvatica]|uniref:Uncharacterized protein n=1 Tax=Planotetraspora silvatica TaxID=234614 RepID=A0A8J3URG9_9ACTN|nr:hypothetical protein Psi02_63610 [Planotetraspora silvatica]